MEGNNDYLNQLSKSLHDYRYALEKKIPELKEHYRILGSFFSNTKKIFIKKGLIAEDPYQYEKKLSDINPISTDGFQENEKSTIIGIRLSEFESQLDFLQNFYDFSLDALNLSKLKKLILFTKFILWGAVGPNHANINTRVVGELIQKIRHSDDPMGINLLNDGLKQLAIYQDKILGTLKEMTLYLRENYKFLLREVLWPSVNLSPALWAQDQEASVREVKKHFARNLRDQPFVPELVKEALEEDLTQGGVGLREDVLKKLATKKNTTPLAPQDKDYKATILEAVRLLGGANLALESALRKMRENSIILENQAQSFGDKFKTWLMGLVGQKTKAKVYVLEFFDPITSASKTEKLDFTLFDEQSTKTVRVLINISTRNSPQFKALMAKEEEKIQEYHQNTFSGLKKTVDILSALDTFFKAEAPREKRNAIKGIKTELTELNQILAKSNKLRHEYVAAKEEVEQLQRLGIQA